MEPTPHCRGALVFWWNRVDLFFSQRGGAFFLHINPCVPRVARCPSLSCLVFSQRSCKYYASTTRRGGSVDHNPVSHVVDGGNLFALGASPLVSRNVAMGGIDRCVECGWTGVPHHCTSTHQGHGSRHVKVLGFTLFHPFGCLFFQDHTVPVDMVGYCVGSGGRPFADQMRKKIDFVAPLFHPQ